MANTLENTLDKVGSAIETLFGSKKPTEPSPTSVTTGQTCLERFGMEARKEHLLRNEWKKDLQYTKLLVNSEYDIQTEFEISSEGEDLEEMERIAAERQEAKEWKKAYKEYKKADKKLEKAKRKYQKRLDKEVNKEPQKPAERLDGDYERIQHDTYSPTDYNLYGYDMA